MREQTECFAREGKSRGGGGNLITKGLTEVGEEESIEVGEPESRQDPGTRVWLPGNQPQLPVALVTVNGGALATNYP